MYNTHITHKTHLGEEVVVGAQFARLELVDAFLYGLVLPLDLLLRLDAVLFLLLAGLEGWCAWM